MKKRLLVLLPGLLAIGALDAQQSNFVCNFYGEPVSMQLIEQTIQDADPDDRETLPLVDKILSPTGLPQNFALLPDNNIKQACAVIVEKSRYLLYNEEFMTKARGDSVLDWTALGILAHSMGHLLNGHTNDGWGTRLEKELQADEFAGYVLGLLGATLPQAQQAIRAVKTDQDGDQYPGRSKRLKAIASGWDRTGQTVEAGSKDKQARKKIFAKTASQQLILQMPEGLGTNGAGVTYNSVERNYYAVFAGNQSFPMAQFTLSGTLIAASEAGIDARGIWFNPNTKAIEFNPYGGEDQPDPQSVGAYDAGDKKIYYWDGELLYRYNSRTQRQEAKIPVSYKSKADLNMTTPIFTGIEGQEIGLLNVLEKKVVLFNKSTGKYSGYIQLPEDAPTKTQFNFSFANGIIWLFDIKNRRWIGYAAYAAP